MIGIRWVLAEKEDEEGVVMTIKPETGHVDKGQPYMQPRALKLQFQQEMNGKWYTAKIEIEEYKE